jgi:hypothetical protein
MPFAVIAIQGLLLAIPKLIKKGDTAVEPENEVSDDKHAGRTAEMPKSVTHNEPSSSLSLVGKTVDTVENSGPPSASNARSSSTTLDLDAEPKLPFPLASVQSHQKGGIVAIERRPDGLYIASRRVLLHSVEKQVAGIQGPELRIDLASSAVLNVNALHFLIENQEFIPSNEEWRRDEQGDVVMIYFWGTVFRHPSGDLCVVYMKWDGTTWDWFCSSLANYWLTNKPAAILAE